MRTSLSGIVVSHPTVAAIKHANVIARADLDALLRVVVLNIWINSLCFRWKEIQATNVPD